MAARFGSYLLPSLIVHCAFFAMLAHVPATVQSSSKVAAVEFVTITDLGGGRTGDDEQIGDAAKRAVDRPEQKFREVRPVPRPVEAPPIAEPRPTPKVAPTAPDAAKSSEARTAEGSEASSGAATPSLVMGSAGSNPTATSAGSGGGQEGIDRRSALRAWLREIQREVNKIATRNYPSSAVRMRLEGKLRLGITIGVDGRIVAVRVLSSSGHAVLDDSAAESVMALNIPAPPQTLRWSEREISLPIRYALQ